jgi:putative salt-induced outer membrane protein
MRSTLLLRCERTAILVVAALALPRAGVAQDTCPCPPPEPPPPLWTGSLGLSYLASSGNTETSSLGMLASFARKPTPWGVEGSAVVNHAESEGEETADRTFAGLRGTRAFGDRWQAFAGLSYEKDRFAGFDRRMVAELGGTYKVLTGPKHELALDAGLTWTDEDPVTEVEANSYFGGVLGAAYALKISDSATFRERLLFFPDFDDSDNWRFTSDTALEATIISSWALRVGYYYARDNVPPLGFEKSDSTTSVSVVWKR